MPSRQQRKTVVSLPAAVAGWNSNAAWDAMRPDEAIELVNWFPDSDALVTRQGFTESVDDLGTTNNTQIKSLIDWSGANGSTELLAATDTRIYKLNISGATFTSLTTVTSGIFSHVNYGGYTVMVNGANTPRRFNGTTLAATTFAGTFGGGALTTSNLVQIEVFKNRLYMVEASKARYWYGGVGSVLGGTLTAFDVGQVTKNGGYLVANGTWSADSGDGKDDLFVSVMSTGETLIYQGSYPGDVSWSKIGSYYAAPPIGRRCMARVGGELVILTRSGLMPASVLLRGGTADSVILHPLFGKSWTAIRDLAEAYGDNAGWQIWSPPGQNRLYVNVPLGGGMYDQLVVNTQTGAWGRFNGLDGYVFGHKGTATYFGGSGAVYAIGGNSDEGEDIISRARGAFVYLGGRGPRKTVTRIRPVMRLSGEVTATLGLDKNFNQRSWPVGNVTLKNASSGGAEWDDEDWDVPSWGGQPGAMYRWYAAGGTGNCFSVYLEVRAKQEIRWYSTDFEGQLGSGS